MQELVIPVGAKILFFMLLFMCILILLAVVFDIITAILSLFFPIFEMGSALDFTLQILSSVLAMPVIFMILIFDEVLFIKPCRNKNASSFFCPRK